MTSLLLAILLCAPAGEAMKATLVEGRATAGGQPLWEGDLLHAGETVETQAGGRVEIALEGGSLIRLGESSRLTLSPAGMERSFSARLWVGNLWARVHLLLAGKPFEIETENGIAGVRGTEFRVEVAEGQPDLLRVYVGTVEVAARDGRWTHQVEGGRELAFRRDAEGPRSFDPAGEKGHGFMDWVRSRKTPDGEEPGRIRREQRSPEQEHRLLERKQRPRER
ncbi:MAG TPA: FecR family protein [Myxococcales bacterium]|nr:FecR family protein [Myxococcales bacterium]